MAYYCNVIKKILIAPIKFYRLTLSALLGNCCRFEPTCSQYAMDAIKLHGGLKGCYLITRRLLRCHPWHPGGIDQVPKKESRVNGLNPFNKNKGLTK